MGDNRDNHGDFFTNSPTSSTCSPYDIYDVNTCDGYVFKLHYFWTKLRSLPIFHANLEFFHHCSTCSLHLPSVFSSKFPAPRNGLIEEGWPPPWASVTWPRFRLEPARHETVRVHGVSHICNYVCIYIYIYT